jgi:adenine-specific DNA-methyltransferase
MLIHPQNNQIKKSKLDKIVLNENQIQKWQDYLTNIQKAYDKKESEEHQKNIFNDFLKDCFGYDVNTNGKQDNVVYDNDKAQVIIEFKALFNQNEMSTWENINRKTLQQLVYYYLQETRENKSIKHLIITNGKDFLIWDGMDFETIFGGDKLLKKEFLDFEDFLKVRFFS